MGKLPVGQKILRTIVTIILVLLPLMACAWIVVENGWFLKNSGITALVLLLPIVFVIVGLKLIRRAWK
ncbi:hypothetical protein KJ590_01275 [Patescibacteria group bacterium]|nr:hypothetical protein [Patescibacteria group bacterium]MBU4142618.1 hypothetical protein [Patescibacteria group bacterium]